RAQARGRRAGSGGAGGGSGRSGGGGGAVRGGSRSARCQGGAHPAARVGGRAGHGAAIDAELVVGVVVGDDRAAGLVVDRGAAQAAHLGAADEPDLVGAAVVLDGLGLALDEFVHPFALLAEVGLLARLGRDHAGLEAFGVL